MATTATSTSLNMFTRRKTTSKMKYYTIILSRLGPNILHNINPLETKGSLLYLKTQFVPRSKHFSSRL